MRQLAPRLIDSWENWLANEVAEHQVPTLDLDHAILLPRPRQAAIRLAFASRTAMLEFTYGFMQLEDVDFPRALYGQLHRAFSAMPTLLDGQPRQIPGRKLITWRIHSAVLRAHWEHSGIDPLLGDVWPAIAYDPSADYWPRPIDFTGLKTDWLRQAIKDWARELRPPIRELRSALRCLTHADPVLRASGRAPRALRSEDATTVWRHFNDLDAAAGTRGIWVAQFFGLIAEFKAMGVPIHHSFIRRRTHIVAKEDRDRLRRDLPVEIVAQLDANLDKFVYRAAPNRIRYPVAVADAIRRNFYIVARETGRRCGEMITLRRNCLVEEDGQFSVRYNNHKAARNGRLLPTTIAASEAIRDMLNVLDEHQIHGPWLFPAAGTSEAGHLPGSGAAEMIRAWVSQVDFGDFDPDRITWHAFRHTYAQRHADAGTDPDVLRELLDHKNLAVTMVYYQVNDDRKRKAVQAMNRHVIDITGTARPFDSTARARIGSVAVPFGLCTEPTNVDSGGKDCPIRYQCSGCSHFRTEPSFLPVVDDHLRRLRVNLERARAMNVAAWTIAGMEKEIASYVAMTNTLQARIEQMSSDERAGLEQHAATLRKARALVKLENPRVR